MPTREITVAIVLPPVPGMKEVFEWAYAVHGKTVMKGHEATNLHSPTDREKHATVSLAARLRVESVLQDRLLVLAFVHTTRSAGNIP